MFGQIGNAVKRNPLGSTFVFSLSAFGIATKILAPEAFAEAIEQLGERDNNEAFNYLAAFIALTCFSEIAPLIQYKLIIPGGTGLGERTISQAMKSFFNIPKVAVDPRTGESHPFVPEGFGGVFQPGGVVHNTLPVTMDIVTSVSELIAINAYMGYRLGNVAWLTLAQTMFSLISTGPMAKIISTGVISFIEQLYKGFSLSIVFANGYVTNIICNQQKKASDELHSFVVNKLIPSTKKYLNINANALMVPHVIGALILLAQCYYATEDDSLTPSEFILLMLYSLTITRSSEKLVQKLIEGISSYGLFYNTTKYISQGLTPNIKEFQVPEKADIVINKISYKHPKANKKLFKDLSINVRAGQVVALTGGNGTGKSTLFEMLTCLIHPDKGEILLGGQNIAELESNSVRSTFAILEQEPSIKEGSFADNIRCQYLNATDEEILGVMIETGLDKQFTPDTVIKFDHKGAILSGGEKQRLIIARALLAIKLGDIKYLFFDEAVSALDEAGKSTLLQLLNKVIREKNITTVMITHELAYMKKYIDFDKEIDLTELKLSAKQHANLYTFFANRPETTTGIAIRPNEAIDMRL